MYAIRSYYVIRNRFPFCICTKLENNIELSVTFSTVPINKPVLGFSDIAFDTFGA